MAPKSETWPISEDQARAVREGMGSMPIDSVRPPGRGKCIGIEGLGDAMFEWVYAEDSNHDTKD